MPDEDTVARLMQLFEGMNSAHGTHGEPTQEEGSLKWGIHASARTPRTPVTRELWEQHLAGTLPLGIITIREDSKCVWGSIDYDVYDRDQAELLRKVEKARLPLVPCRSKSGGLHLFLFLTEPVEASAVIEALKDVAASIGIGGSEIFPKQRRVLTEKGDLGSWIIMPYFGNTYDGKLREQVGLRYTGAELTLEEFLRAAERQKVSPEKLQEIMANRRGRKTSSKARNGVKAVEDESEPFGDGPPCLQHLAREKVANGGRNNALFMMGIYYKKKYPNEWREHLDEANKEFLQNPGSSEDVVAIARSIERKDYEYTCTAEPMASYCDSRACRHRHYGIGSWGEWPEVSGLSVLRTDPAIWFVDVDGERLEIGTADLMSYGRFQMVCMEKLQRCYRLMKQDSWLKILFEAMTNVTTIEPPPDALAGAALREAMYEFLVNRAKGDRREDMLLGRPWENEERSRFEFRLKDLQKFLRRDGHDPMTRGELVREIEKMDGGHGFYNIDNHGCNYWYVPSAKVGAQVSVDLPGIKDNDVAGEAM